MRDVLWTSSVLILVIALLRRVLRGKIDPRLQYALWFLAAARLLIPGFLFTVPVSVTEAADLWQNAWKNAFRCQVVQPAVQGQDAAVPALNAAPVPAAPDGLPANLPAQDNALAPTSDWSSMVWKAGAAVAAGAMLVSNLRFYCCLRRNRRRLDLPPPSGAPELAVYLVDGLPSPCLFGAFRPAVYLNAQALRSDCTAHVLAHEYTHFRHGDHIWALLRGVCLAVHWYNPLVWWAAAMSVQDGELACDCGAIHLLGEERRLDYGAALLRMAAAERFPLLRFSTSLSAGKRNLKERIVRIADRPQMLHITLAAVVLVMCGAVAVTFGAAADPADADAFAEHGGTDTELQNMELPAVSRLQSAGRLASVQYTHFSGLFSLTVPENWLKDVIYVESEDGVYFYDASAYEMSEGSGWLMTVVPQPTEWAEVYDQDGLPLAEFNFNGSPYMYMLDLNPEPVYSEETREHILSLMEQCGEVAEGFHFLAAADDISRLAHDSYEGNMPLTVAYLPYLSWDSYQEVYDEKEMFSLLSAIERFTYTGGLSWDQYHDIMSNRTTHVIDGAYAECYEAIIRNLYQQNPQQFTSVLMSSFLTEDERTHMLFWARDFLTNAEVQ